MCSPWSILQKIGRGSSQLPSILTEDIDETCEMSYDSNYHHYHTVTGATPGIRPLIKPLLKAKDDERLRHRSGEDLSSKPQKHSSLLDIFRPRSKSDASRMKKPTFMSKMQSAMQVRTVE